MQVLAITSPQKVTSTTTVIGITSRMGIGMSKETKLRIWLGYTAIHALGGLWVATDKTTREWFMELHPFVLALLGIYWVWWLLVAGVVGSMLSEEQL